jgi:hypothetical protein
MSVPINVVRSMLQNSHTEAVEGDGLGDGLADFEAKLTRLVFGCAAFLCVILSMIFTRSLFVCCVQSFMKIRSEVRERRLVVQNITGTIDRLKGDVMYLNSLGSLKNGIMPSIFSDTNTVKAPLFSIGRNTVLIVIYSIELTFLAFGVFVSFAMIGSRIDPYGIVFLAAAIMLFSSRGILSNVLCGLSLLWGGMVTEGQCVRIGEHSYKIVAINVTHTCIQRNVTGDEVVGIQMDIKGIHDKKYGFHTSIEKDSGTHRNRLFGYIKRIVRNKPLILGRQSSMDDSSSDEECPTSSYTVAEVMCIPNSDMFLKPLRVLAADTQVV